MRIKTIWTIPGMALAERLRRTRSSLLLSLAHYLPQRLRYAVLIDTGARHMQNDVVPEVAFMAVLERAGQGIENW